MMKLRKNYLMSGFTTMAIGGPAKFFVAVKSESELVAAIQTAKAAKLKWCVLGEGSNLIVADKGYEGVVIQNKIQKFDLSPNPLSISPYPHLRRGRGRKVTIGAGNNLLKTIIKLDQLGLSGLEKMAGIPGTVGGAVYGCAGAYGQEIKDNLLKVRFFDGRKIREFSRERCRFGYRTSIFKKNKDWIIVAAVFRFETGAPARLLEASRKIIKLRAIKYPPGLRCPGSFFKNIKLVDLRPVSARNSFVKKLPHEKIMYGKVPVGYLLEAAGAKGIRSRGIRVAAHHGNLIYNAGRGRAKDVRDLAARLKALVKKEFGITIEEEVQYLGF